MPKILDISIGTIRKREEDYNFKIPRNEKGYRVYTSKELDVFNKIIKIKN